MRPNVRCPVGEAKLTPGFGLKADFVIHTVGPVYRHHPFQRAAELLHSCYTSSIRLARQAMVKTIAFPAISCGIYGYPLSSAADISIAALIESCEPVRSAGKRPYHVSQLPPLRAHIASHHVHACPRPRQQPRARARNLRPRSQVSEGYGEIQEVHFVLFDDEAVSEYRDGAERAKLVLIGRTSATDEAQLE